MYIRSGSVRLGFQKGNLRSLFGISLSRSRLSTHALNLIADSCPSQMVGMNVQCRTKGERSTMPTLRKLIARALDIPIEDLALPVDWAEEADKKLYLSVSTNDGSDEQMASDKVCILLDILMDERGYTLDQAEQLISSTLKTLVKDSK